MIYTLMVLGLNAACFLAGYLAGVRKAPPAPQLPPGTQYLHSLTQQDRMRKLRQTIDKYEDFVMRLGADDVGNPQLEARVLLQETRRDNDTL